jgi:hypothetical protein
VTGVRTPAVEREVPVAGIVAVVALIVLAVSRQQLAGLFDSGTSLEWMTVFIAVAVQATPFLVLGVVMSGLVRRLLVADVAGSGAASQPGGVRGRRRCRRARNARL